MSPLELTESALRRLLADVVPDLETLDQVAARIAKARGTQTDTESDDAARAYLATELHRYYTALESVLERILRCVDGSVAAGTTWHRDLLRQASRQVPETRPAILGAAVVAELSHLLSFRHFFRHAYAVELDWDELEAHRRRVAAVHPDALAGVNSMMQHLQASLAALAKMGAQPDAHADVPASPGGKSPDGDPASPGGKGPDGDPASPGGKGPDGAA